MPYPSGSPNVHDVPSGDIVPVTAVPSGLVTCRAVIVPWATVIVTGAVGDSPAAPNADGTVTRAAAAAGVDAPVGQRTAGSGQRSTLSRHSRMPGQVRVPGRNRRKPTDTSVSIPPATPGARALTFTGDEITLEDTALGQQATVAEGRNHDAARGSSWSAAAGAVHQRLLVRSDGSAQRRR